jgi:hypothetical protein
MVASGKCSNRPNDQYVSSAACIFVTDCRFYHDGVYSEPRSQSALKVFWKICMTWGALA